jgi:hypothetical protein
VREELERRRGRCRNPSRASSPEAGERVLVVVDDVFSGRQLAVDERRPELP